MPGMSSRSCSKNRSPWVMMAIATSIGAELGSVIGQKWQQRCLGRPGELFRLNCCRDALLRKLIDQLLRTRLRLKDSELNLGSAGGVA